MDQKVSEVRRHRGRLSTEEALEIFKSPEIVEAALEGKAQIERGESVRLTLDEIRAEIQGAGVEPHS